MYAVVELSGKQHKVEVDQTLDIDLQKVEKGSKITFENVLLLADGDNVQIGQSEHCHHQQAARHFQRLSLNLFLLFEGQYQVFDQLQLYAVFH